MNFATVEKIGEIIGKTFWFTCVPFNGYADELYNYPGNQMEIVYDSGTISLFTMQKQN